MGKKPFLSKEKSRLKLTNKCPITQKKIFDTLEEASKRAKYIRKRMGPKVSAYECKYCGKYHLGHNRPPHRRRPKDDIISVLA